MEKYWYVKIVVMVLALVGIILMMQNLRSDPIGQHPSGPMQTLLGAGLPSPDGPAKAQTVPKDSGTDSSR